MIPTDYYQRTHVRNLFAETDSALSKVTQHTHYSLETWIGRGSDAATYKAVKSMFQYKAQLFANEVASVILAPYVLCVKWAQSSEAICEYIFCIKTDLGCSGGGEVCGYATFDFDRVSQSYLLRDSQGTISATLSPAMTPLCILCHLYNYT